MGRDDETRREEPPFTFEDVWPDDEPFPFTNAECARLVRDHAVRWRGTMDEALSLPGTYEIWWTVGFMCAAPEASGRAPAATGCEALASSSGAEGGQ